LQRTTNNTWGLGFTEQGDVMGSTANNNPSWILSIPSAAYTGSGIEPGPTPRADTSTIIYPNTLDITQVDQINRYTAAAGHQFYTDTLLDGVLQSNNVLVCEPTGHAVGLGMVVDHESLKATHFRGNNLFASSDAWSSPVVARAGPDGAVWIADWYNPIIQHNVVFRFWNPARGYDYPHSPYQIGEQKPGKGNAYVTPLRDQSHGRIWRVVPANGNVRKPINLDPHKSATLIAGLQSPSQHTRLHAQRLLIERGKPDMVADLISLVFGKAVSAIHVIHAIWTLEGLGVLPGSPAYQALESALGHDDAIVSRHAMLALGAGDPAVVRALPRLLTTTRNPRELLLMLSAAAQAPSNEPIAQALWQVATRETKLDASQSEAIRLAMRRQGSTLLAVAFTADLPEGWAGQEILEIAKRIAAGPNRAALVAMQATAPAGVRPKIDEILNAAPAPEPTEPELPEHLLAGQTIYLKACIECHQADGNGVEATFPPLVDSEWVKGDTRTLLRIMLGGVYGPIQVNGVEFNSAMPGQIHLTDDEIAATASYVRHAFGKQVGNPIAPSEVKTLRPEIEERKFTPWTAGELLKLEKN
ncbi:MAG: c-type cytochrome, partial [Akkermansiaceae bacterium]